MEHVRLADLDSWLSPADRKLPLGRALGAENMGINYYELGPGDAFAFGYHTHSEQEEVFYVIAGTATFETEDGDVEVSAGEALRVSPGEFQRGTNRGEERVVALAIGAPKDGGETTILRECPECGERTPQRIERAPDTEDALVTLCEACGTETGRYT